FFGFGFSGFAFGVGLFLFLVLGLVEFDDFGGEQAHFLDAANGLVLAGDFQGALGLLAMGIHGDVIELRHNGLCVLDDFFNGCITVEDAAQAVLAQRDHAELDGLLANHDRGGAFVDQGADGIVNDEQLEDAAPAFVAGVVAGGAAAAIIKD